MQNTSAPGCLYGCCVTYAALQPPPLLYGTAAYGSVVRHASVGFQATFKDVTDLFAMSF